MHNAATSASSEPAPISGQAAPLVSILLPCRNEVKHIEHCLESAMQQQPPEGGFEIIVADGMSEDGTREVLEKIAQRDSRVRVIDNPRRIVSSGLNAAIAVASGKIIVRMDAHTDYAPDYVKQCVAVLQRTGADNVGGPARTRATGYTARAVAAAYHSPFAVGGARFHDTSYEGYLDTVTYGCWLKDSFQQFGMFDEELVRNQDDEHNLRISRGGGKIYQSPSIQSWYRPRSSLSTLFRQYMQYGYWKVRVIQKHKLPASIRHLVPGTFVFLLILLSLLSLASAGWDVAHGGIGSWSVVTRVLAALLGLQVGCYALAVLAASFVTAARTEWALLPMLPWVFPCYHLGYGYGFLQGFWAFVIRRKGASDAFVQLTRDSKK